MRVITGQARGRRLISPEGNDVRPTTDKVKESLFNIIQFRLAGACVLDLFAGSGQLGIEALSRGAEKAVFVDSSRKSLDVVKKNIELCKFTSQAQTFLLDAAAYLRMTSEKFDVVILDPPYHKNLCVSALELLGNAVNEDAVVICETQSDEELPENVGCFIIDRVYSYSSIKLTVYRVDN
ncbi:MAG: 16S rRNA (guanine(966)-N(2))-methyltransferase RsmD [Clostridia bacterium]|nr:16S rRNA (guanine(966)-N(2))-methyltransferase RsmD [Clostridia bacterium]